MTNENAGANAGAVALGEDTFDINEVPELSTDATPPESTENANTDIQPDAPPQGAAPTAPVWDGSQFQLKFRDKQIVPKSKEELVKLAQQGYSYSQRMGELNRREQELNATKEQLAKVQELAEALEGNPAFKEKLFQIYAEMQNGGGEQVVDPNGATQVPSVDPKIKEELDGLKRWKQSFEDEKADQAVSQEIDGMKNKFTGEDWETPSESGKTLVEEVIEHAIKLGNVPLQTAYKDLRWEKALENSKADALKKQAEAAQAARAKGVIATDSSAPAPGSKTMNVHNMTYDQITREILKD